METLLWKFRSQSQGRSYRWNWAGGRSQIEGKAGHINTRVSYRCLPPSPPLPTKKTYTQTHATPTLFAALIHIWNIPLVSEVRLSPVFTLSNPTRVDLKSGSGTGGILQRWLIMRIKSPTPPSSSSSSPPGRRRRSGMYSGEEAIEQPGAATLGLGKMREGRRKTHLAENCAPLRRTTRFHQNVSRHDYHQQLPPGGARYFSKI